jgi:RNA polymerase sigma-70 factor, ECF subfamily
VDLQPGDITTLLDRVRQGDEQAQSELMDAVYGQLRRLAAHCLRTERAAHTFQPTALVHEAWMELAGQREKHWENRVHFFAVAAQSMRRVLVDYARWKGAHKRGGKTARLPLDEVFLFQESDPSSFLDLDDALKRLAQFDFRLSRVVELRFFGGLSEEEIAGVLKIGVRTVKRDWKMARAWLIEQLGQSAS